MKLLTYTISFREMQQRVKEETSHFGVRQANEQGQNLYENYVFHEGSESLYRGYFNSATAELAGAFATYSKQMPITSMADETNDNELYEDYIMQLPMPDNWNDAYQTSIGVLASDYILSSILQRWYETKVPATAQIYERKCYEILQKIKGQLNKRINMILRGIGYW